MSSESNRRIAKNTVMLYMRMLLTMAVSLYTSRIVLNTLGVDDYGIYNVVGGFVTMFGFLNTSMASATQRFLSFELGKKDYPQLAMVFNMSVNIHVIIALVILVLAEIIGLWFVNNYLIISAERMSAANWVYQFSILAFIVTVISVPYNAAIIAHERMNVYAWVSIIEVSLKLLIVFMLQWFGFDKLKLYAVLVFMVSIIIRLIYGSYCCHNFAETKFRFVWHKPLFKTLMSYASWNLWGNAAVAMYSQGVNILLNIFFGPALNAAAAIAYQVKGSVSGFVQNFQLAMNPQITKSFASDDLKHMHQLIFYGAKYSFFLLFALSLPILMETETILKLWLKIVPEYTVIFTQLIIISSLINSLSGPLMTAAQASGKIKLYQTVVGGLLLLVLPSSYLVFKLGFPPQMTFYISISIYIIALFARLKIVSHLINLSTTQYVINVVLRIVPVVVISVIIPMYLKHFLPPCLPKLFIILFSSVLSVILAIYWIGLKREEQIFMQRKIKQALVKITG